MSTGQITIKVERNINFNQSFSLLSGKHSVFYEGDSLDNKFATLYISPDDSDEPFAEIVLFENGKEIEFSQPIYEINDGDTYELDNTLVTLKTYNH